MEYEVQVRGPYAEPPLWVMKATVFDAAGAECKPEDVFVRFHAEGAGPDFLPVIVPAGQKNEGGHIWSEFGPLQGPTTVYTAQLVDGAGYLLSPIALCDNRLRPVDWESLIGKGPEKRTPAQALDVTAGQVHSWFAIEFRPAGSTPPPPGPGPDPRIAELEARVAELEEALVAARIRTASIPDLLESLADLVHESLVIIDNALAGEPHA